MCTSLAPAAPHHPHDLPARRPAHDRVVHEDDALALEDAADGIQLHAHAEMAYRLLRLDEGAPDVMALSPLQTGGPAHLVLIAALIAAFNWLQSLGAAPESSRPVWTRCWCRFSSAPVANC